MIARLYVSTKSPSYSKVMSAVKLSFLICTIVAVIAEVVAALRGKTYIYRVTAEENAKSYAGLRAH